MWHDAHLELAWAGPGAGHDRPAVSSCLGDRQPVIVAVDGLLCNVDGGGPGGAESLLASYLALGQSVVDRINGVFAIAIWDSRSEVLLLARDRLGSRPLCYAPLADGVVFASMPGVILASGTVEAAIDEDGARELFGRQRTIGATVWKGIDEVRPGELIAFSRTGPSRRRYWRLEPRPHTHDVRQTISTVRDLLEDSVRLLLTAGEPVLSLLSGGIDSSAVTALAGLEGRRRATPLLTFTLDYAGSADSFRPDELRPTLDAPYARLAAQHLGATHAEVVVDSGQLADQAFRLDILRAYDRPPVQEDYAGSLLWLYREVSRVGPAILSGELSDEQFRYEDQNMHGDCFPWHVALAGIRPFSILHPDLEARLRLDEFYRQQHATALAESALVEGGDRSRWARRFTYLHLTRYSPVLLERQDRMSAAAGVDVKMPFGDHRLVEYLFNVPEDIRLFDGGESKSVLRAAAGDLLPVAVLHRSSSQHPVPRGDAYDDLIADEFRALARRRSAPVVEIAGPARMAWLAKDRDRGSSRLYVRRIRADVLALNRFLEAYDVKLLFV